MGVQGLARLLREEGFLPADSSCAKTLWRAQHGDLLLNDADVVQIPPHSTLAIDGNGLAYYLHHVAYSRHFSQVTGGDCPGSPLKKTSTCCCNTRHLWEQQVTRLLPQYMPLSLLQNVTREFVETLQRHHIKLHVYWDGDARRMKAATTSKRKETRDSEWSHLKQYSLYGVVPTHPSSSSSSTSTTRCRKDWLYNFPMSRLLLHTVKHALSQYDAVNMIQCEEEADRQVAYASAQDPNCYSVGLDSDYCLFPNTRYIPLNTLNASGSVVSATVLTRSQLAEQLDLPSEQCMVELAILMGNDYVENTKHSQLDFTSGKVEDILNHIREQDEDYRVTTKVPQVQQAIDFTRALYEFQDLSDFPFDQEEEETNTSTDVAVNNDEQDPARPLLPVALDLALLEPQPFDFSIAKVVARPIQALLDSMEEDERSLIRQEHLDTFLELVERLRQQETRPLALTDDEIVRPMWENILGAYVIERMIAHVYRENPSSPLVRLSSPAQLFDHALFHSILKAKSDSVVVDTKTAPTTRTSDKPVEEPKEVERTTLPIDEHETAILDAVDNQRVTIIHGETGCGKSSRVPVMLLRAPPPDPSLQRVKMFISQPRRIAAKSLVERVRSCEPDLRNAIALRMGHGVREYETPKTRAWFVTTGYLVRLLANHPENFNDCSHLIIDEVHERSVDTDILCLLCRRLLDSNQRIRLILMSATMAATLYQQYFGVPQPPIHVGARRFPIKEYYVEDMIKRFTFPSSDMKAAKAVINDCDRLNCMGPPSNSYMENLFRLAARMVMCVGRPGSSILIFVPGMNEIISITDLVEKQYIPGIRFTCYPIHSDVPFEEQMTAFDAPAADEVKVVIATNAAESSVTLPDVDHVICLGLCKQIVYNASSHRQMLMPAWISRASAIQRAGRTGRVRKGNVYRLYTRTAFEENMDLFETGEMLRVPLDSVILTLKEMLQEEATPVLLQCLEPPDLSTIERSFKSLCHSNFITNPDDTGTITTLGKFVSSLGIDLTLGSFIGLGIQFGVGAEAIEIAAILSFPKTPWIMTSPLFHDPPEFNGMLSLLNLALDCLCLHSLSQSYSVSL
jgi:5'-3' exonuclease